MKSRRELTTTHNITSYSCAQLSALQGSVVAERIDDLAERVERLIVSSRAPERFFEEKSENAEGLRHIAYEVLNG